jgi:hypothetical protein
VLRISTRHQERKWLLLFLVVFGVLVATNAFAQDATEVLKTTLSEMQKSEQWWDRLWKDTFEPTTSNNISIYAFTSAVRFVMAIGLIFWLFQYGQKIASSQGIAQAISNGTQLFFPVFLAVLFLSNQASYSRLLAYGLRDTVNGWSQGVMRTQIAGVNIRAALSDQFVTQDAINELSVQAQKCRQMPQPAVALPSPDRPPNDSDKPLTIQQEQAYQYLECIQKLSEMAASKKQDAIDRDCGNSFLVSVQGCQYFRRVSSKYDAEIKKIEQQEQQWRSQGFTVSPQSGWEELGIGLRTLFTEATYTPTLNATQWMWINLLEMAMWLSALFAPMFIAASIIPGRQNMFFAWLITFLTIGLAKLAYTIVIGVVAVQLSKQVDPAFSDTRFPMVLGLFAPGVSLAVVAGGGLAAAMSFRSQSVAVVGAVAGAVSGSIASLGYSITRYADKRR